MTSYVSTNRLRLRMKGGLCGRAATVTGASGYYDIVHGLGSPTIFGAWIESTAVTTTAQITRTCKVRLSGAVLRVRVATANAGVSAPAATAPLRWFAAE